MGRIAHDASARVGKDPAGMDDDVVNAAGGALGLCSGREVSPGAAGELNAEIARSVVKIYRTTCGRGPTKARSTFRGDAVVVILEGVVTPAERSLVEGGRSHEARELRRQLHDVMRAPLASVVAELTAASVRAVLGDTDCDADVAVEVFVLDRVVDPGRGAVALG
jgi:uncharacterized protein YbcI